MSENINTRIKFEKTGKLQFISHLDLCRTMKTAMIRARIPIWYSEGFNPRPKMVFALPLSIGIESICEYMDIKITEELQPEMILNQLNNATTCELNITDVYTPLMKFNEIVWAEYIIKFNTLNISNAGVIFESPFIIVKRPKNNEKNSEKKIDVLPLIKRYEISDNMIKVLISAESSSYLNPEYIASAVSARFNIPDYSITRINLYIDDGITVFK